MYSAVYFYTSEEMFSSIINLYKSQERVNMFVNIGDIHKLVCPLAQLLEHQETDNRTGNDENQHPSNG